QLWGSRLCLISARQADGIRTALNASGRPHGRPDAYDRYLVESTAAGARAAVAARVTRSGAHHATAAAVALDGVLVRVEERGLTRGGSLDRLRAAVRVLVGELRANLGGEDPRLLLLVDVEELLPEPAEDVVDERLRSADVRIVRGARRLEAKVRELRDV